MLILCFNKFFFLNESLLPNLIAALPQFFAKRGVPVRQIQSVFILELEEALVLVQWFLFVEHGGLGSVLKGY